MKKRQPVRKRLPRDFRPNDGAAADLFPELIAQRAFFDVAEVVGVDEAKRIFETVMKQANRLLPVTTKPTGAHQPLVDAQLVSLWRMWSRQNGEHKTDFARWYQKTEWCPEKYRAVLPATVVHRLDDLLKKAG